MPKRILNTDWSYWIKEKGWQLSEGTVERVKKLPEKELEHQISMYEYNIHSANTVLQSLKKMKEKDFKTDCPWKNRCIGFLEKECPKLYKICWRNK